MRFRTEVVIGAKVRGRGRVKFRVRARARVRVRVRVRVRERVRVGDMLIKSFQRPLRQITTGFNLTTYPYGCT